jgi:uncharacterized peroxidase-related enzyme
MKPMYLKDVENNPQPSGWRGKMIETMRAANAPIPQILHMLAFKPDVTRELENFTQKVMRGPSPLSPGLRELIATYTSASNLCPFCRNSHAAVAGDLLGDAPLVTAVLRDLEAAPVNEAERALLVFVKKVTQNLPAVAEADIEALHSHGWSDEAIYDAVTVCALFNFYNRWVSASGVGDMTPEAYNKTAARLAKGYTEQAQTVQPE